MNGGAVSIVRPDLQTVGKVDDHGSGTWLDVDPPVSGRQGLQTACCVLDQQGQQAGIGVFAECDIVSERVEVAALGSRVPGRRSCSG